MSCSKHSCITPRERPRWEASAREHGSRSPAASRPLRTASRSWPSSCARSGVGAPGRGRAADPARKWTTRQSWNRTLSRGRIGRSVVGHDRQLIVPGPAASAGVRRWWARSVSTCRSPAIPMFADAAGTSSAAGLANGALLLATVAGELATPRLVARVGYRWALAAGLVLLGTPALVLLRASARPSRRSSP